MRRIVLAVSLIGLFAFGDTILKDENGRYEFVQTGELRADHYMVDTRTGRLWGVVYDERLDITFLSTIYYSDKKISPDEAGIKNTDGRYKFNQTGKLRRDHYMLDTKTGRLWQVVQVGDSNTTVLEPMTYDNGKNMPNFIKE